MTNPHKKFLALGVVSLCLGLPSSAIAQEDESSWDFFGDFRARAEFNDMASTTDRHRQRLRFRFGANFQVADNVTVGTRLRSDSGDQNNPHFDIGNNFNNIALSLDRAFMKYDPTWADISMTFGKFGNPMKTNPVYGELVWDADVQPEGIALGGQLGRAEWSLGQYALTENSAGSTEDKWMTALQVSNEIDKGFAYSVGYYFYGDHDPANGVEPIVNGGVDAGNYGVLDAVISHKMNDTVFSAEYIENLRADDGIDATGWALGVATGSTASTSGKFYGQYQVVEGGAVFTPYAQDDFNTRANFNGVVMGWKRDLSKRVGLNVWVLTSEPEATNADADTRFRIDFNIKF